VGGYHLPKGTWVHLDIWGIQHDARYWPQPEVFRPERFLPGAAEAEGRHPNAFMAFGLGALCLSSFRSHKVGIQWCFPDVSQ